MSATSSFVRRTSGSGRQGPERTSAISGRQGPEITARTSEALPGGEMKTVPAGKIPASGKTGVVRRLRKQGGATVLAIPSHIVEQLGFEAGSEVRFQVVRGKMVVEAVAPAPPPARRRRRYTLAELLEGAEHLQDYYAGTEGALDGPAVGREIG